MPQNPTPTQIVGFAGFQRTLNVNAPAVIKAGPGTLFRIVVQAAGTAGSLTLNDALTTGAAATANQLYTAAFGNLAAGQVIALLLPCLTGLVVSSVPTGGNFAVTWS